VAALAVYKNPSPFEPFHHKLENFIVEKMFGGLIQTGKMKKEALIGTSSLKAAVASAAGGNLETRGNLKKAASRRLA